MGWITAKDEKRFTSLGGERRMFQLEKIACAKVLRWG